MIIGLREDRFAELDYLIQMEREQRPKRRRPPQRQEKRHALPYPDRRKQYLLDAGKLDQYRAEFGDLP